MANISYGVNILPKTNNAYTLGNSDYKWANIFTNKINGTDVASIIAGGGSGSEGSSIDVSDKVDKAALLDAGLISSIYSTAFGGAFTVTTATGSNHTIPYAKATPTGVINKHKRFRVTINDTEYILESRIWFLGNKFYNYLGDISKVYEHPEYVPGGTDSDVPFLITFDRDNNSSIEVYTTTAGTYTIKIETITDTFKKLPLELIYGSAYAPILQSDNTGSTFNGYSIGVNILQNKRGTIAIGHGNDLRQNFSIAIGGNNIVSSGYTMVMGDNNTIQSNYGYVFGMDNTIYNSGNPVSILGFQNTIQTECATSIAIGYKNTIYANSHRAYAVGYWNLNQGDYSNTFGYSNCAFSDYTTAIGLATLANSKYQITLGTYNVIDTTTAWVGGTSYAVGDKVYINERWYECKTANSDANFTEDHWTRCRGHFVEILGNGNLDTSPKIRSNARATDWNGNTYIKGDVYVNCNADSSGGTKLISATAYATTSAYGIVKVGSGLDIDTNGALTVKIAGDPHVKQGTSGVYVIPCYRQHQAVFYGLAKAAGDSTQSASSNSIGSYTSGALSAIQTMLAVPSNTNPVFTGTFSLNRAANTTIGTNSVSIGENCTASGEDSFSEGRYTTASGYYSHAEGNYTTASGMAAHAEGTVTVANHASQHVFGEYNVEDDSDAANYSRGNFVEIVGNGTSSSAQSNARALDWSGNEYLNGYLYVGCNASSGSGTRIPHDIQIDGTSIVSNGIATIPLAAAYQSAENPGHPGLVHPSADYGTKIQDNVLAISGATESDVKTGTTTRRPLTPLLSKNIVFYGLAKAAGDSTQSASSNAIGTYTADAKSAIQSMLGISTMIGATSSVAGSGGLVPAPATTDVDKFLAGDGTYKSGGLPMVILSYGNSVWQDFINAYNNNVIVYCRASSNSNPATGSQTRMAFMAYVNNATTPTEVEFQYYRSMSSHSATAMGDQVFVYKLNKTNGWSVTTRDASIKEINVASGSKLGVSWSSNKVTLSNTMTANDMPMSSSDATTVKSSIDTLNSKITNNISLLWGVPYHEGKTAGPGTTPTVVASGSKAFKKGTCLLLLEMPVTMSYGSGNIQFVIGTQTVNITVTSGVNSFYIATIDIPADGIYNWSLNIIGNANGSITAGAYETNALYVIEFPS